MNSEETSQPRATEDEPLIPEPTEAPQTLSVETAVPESPLAEPLDDHTLTPPHGDPLAVEPVSPVEAAAAEPEAPAPAAIPPLVAEAPVPASVVEAAEPEPVLAAVEPEPLVEAVEPEPLVEAVEPEPVVTAELPDDHSATPPHGDPLPVEPVTTEVVASASVFAEAVATPAAPEWTAPESVSPLPFEPVAASVVPEAVFGGEAAAAEPEPETAPALETAGFASAPAESYAGAETFGEPPAAKLLEREAPAEPDYWNTAPTLPEAVAAAEPLPEEPIETGPNWMLAFICAWTGITSLNEARVLLPPTGFPPALLHNYGFLGYVLLGLGLLFYALEALRWGKPGRGVGMLFLPSVLTLAGVVCLVLWNDPGRRI